uniref:Uncharacterized protein n=1 Tax=Arundo donax TaxID=35708 RepID=A0A0A9BCW8_ARUDO
MIAAHYPISIHVPLSTRYRCLLQCADINIDDLGLQGQCSLDWKNRCLWNLNTMMVAKANSSSIAVPNEVLLCY